MRCAPRLASAGACRTPQAASTSGSPGPELEQVVRLIEVPRAPPGRRPRMIAAYGGGCCPAGQESVSRIVRGSAVRASSTVTCEVAPIMLSLKRSWKPLRCASSTTRAITPSITPSTAIVLRPCAPRAGARP